MHLLNYRLFSIQEDIVRVYLCVSWPPAPSHPPLPLCHFGSARRRHSHVSPWLDFTASHSVGCEARPSRSRPEKKRGGRNGAAVVQTGCDVMVPDDQLMPVEVDLLLLVVMVQNGLVCQPRREEANRGLTSLSVHRHIKVHLCHIIACV